MSVSQWWMHVLLDSGLESALIPEFGKAIAATQVTKPGSDIIDQWKENPMVLLGDGLIGDRADTSRVTEFQSQFNLTAFQNLGERLVRGHECPLELNEDNLGLLVSTRNITPVSILYFALGPQAAAELPGHFGNALIPSGRVVEVRSLLAQVLDSRKRQEHIERGARFYGLDHYPCETEVAQIVDAWPQALAIAFRRKMGLLSIAMKAP